MKTLKNYLVQSTAFRQGKTLDFSFIWGSEGPDKVTG